MSDDPVLQGSVTELCEERAIKCVGSDLAAHVVSRKIPNLNEDRPIAASGRPSSTNVSSSNASE